MQLTLGSAPANRQIETPVAHSAKCLPEFVSRSTKEQINHFDMLDMWLLNRDLLLRPSNTRSDFARFIRSIFTLITHWMQNHPEWRSRILCINQHVAYLLDHVVWLLIRLLHLISPTSIRLLTFDVRKLLSTPKLSYIKQTIHEQFETFNLATSIRVYNFN